MPKEKIREALNYLSNHWTELRLHLTDGRLPLDNNLVEQLMKQVAIGRKNWLFIGSIPAGERAANFLTLVSSALRNDLDPYDYFRAVLDALLAGTTDFAALRPDAWAKSHPEFIRTYRQRERHDRHLRQSTDRAARRKKTLTIQWTWRALTDERLEMSGSGRLLVGRRLDDRVVVSSTQRFDPSL